MSEKYVDTTTEPIPDVIVPGKRLGKLPPIHDPRTLRLARYIEKRKVPKIPVAHNLSVKTRKAFPQIGMMKNDVLGCCTIAALAHAEQAWSAWGGKPRRPSDAEIIEAYGRVNDGTDGGAAMLDVLNMARKEGIGGNTIYGYVAIDPLDHDQVRTADYLLGGLYFGANLPVSAQREKVWTKTSGPGSEVGSWGGHCMNVWDTTKSGIVVPTWGKLQAITWGWWDRYVDECYAILEEDYVGDDGVSPEGFSFEKLADDLKAL